MLAIFIGGSKIESNAKKRNDIWNLPKCHASVFKSFYYQFRSRRKNTNHTTLKVYSVRLIKALFYTSSSVWSEIGSFVDKSFEMMFTFHSFINENIIQTMSVYKVSWNGNQTSTRANTDNVYKTFRMCWEIEKTHTQCIDTAHLSLEFFAIITAYKKTIEF